MGLESMRIVTGCATPEQFVAGFYRFCDAKTCFIPSRDTRPVGTKLTFSLRLMDGTPMLKGTCVVKATYENNRNPYKRPGVLLDIRELSAESEAMFEILLMQRTAITSQSVAKEVEPVVKDTIEMPPVHREESRTPGSPLVLPANPLSDVDDDALDKMFDSCSLSDTEPPVDDLAIPVEAEKTQRVVREIRTLLGMPPLAKRDTQEMLAHEKPTVQMMPLHEPDTRRTAPLQLVQRPPASLRTVLSFHTWTPDDRIWYLAALGAGVFVTLLVLAGAWLVGP